jgi:hypothetical protein
MRLTEIFEDNNPSKVIGFDMAWHNKKDAIPQKYHSKVRTLAQTQLARDESPSDAISTAWDITKSQLQKQDKTKQKSATVQKDNSPSADRVRQDALGRNLKHDRYYRPSDAKVSSPRAMPSAPAGIGDALSKSTPRALLKKALAPVDKTLGDLLDVDKALSGNLNKNSRRKR